jgi:ankyrin repeat protein
VAAAHRLVERGARTTIDDAATLGLQDRLEGYFAGTAPAPDEVSRAFWGACHGGQRRCAEYLLERGADPNWVPPWEPLTPLDAAARSGADELVGWLRTQGARGRPPGSSRRAGEAARRRRVALEASGPGAQHGRRPADASEQGEQQHPGDGGEPSDPEDLLAYALVDVSSFQGRA